MYRVDISYESFRKKGWREQEKRQREWAEKMSCIENRLFDNLKRRSRFVGMVTEVEENEVENRHEKALKEIIGLQNELVKS